MSNSFLILVILPYNVPESEVPLAYLQDEAENQMIPAKYLVGKLNSNCP